MGPPTEAGTAPIRLVRGAVRARAPSSRARACPVLAATLPSPVREVRFRVDGVEQQRAAAAPYVASLWMPRGVGSRSVLVEAVAVDAQGRESAPVGLSLLVVDDLAEPTLSLTLEPAGFDRIAAGSWLSSTATVTDTAGDAARDAVPAAQRSRGRHGRSGAAVPGARV
ncbi:hypothetical protein ACLESO_58385, partial [Pyxidicoccus sp. 3LG]